MEDNRDAALTLKLLLSFMGHQVEAEFDGPSGLAKAHEFQPEVVIPDSGLPGGIDGYALADALRSDPLLSNAYLIALSGYGQDDDPLNKRHCVRSVFCQAG